VPFDVAMEEPDTRIIGPETEDHVPVWSDEDGIPAHWGFGESDIICVITLIRRRAGDDLECMAVQVEGVFTRVVVIEYDIDDLIPFENIRVRIFTVDCCICCIFTGCKSCEDCGDFRADVCYAIEKGT